MKYFLYGVDSVTLFLTFRAAQEGRWLYAIIFGLLNFCVFRQVVSMEE